MVFRRFPGHPTSPDSPTPRGTLDVSPPGPLGSSAPSGALQHRTAKQIDSSGTG